ncbi:hypothetical protein BGW80DRAFT_1297337 [Lactifluus volemus]|nr:hypothetical protein BGW80DRAFT_1297337 [Lactifluus volemus]
MCSDTQRASTTQCKYPDCTKAVWRDPDGSYSSFCGNYHRLAMANHPRSQTRMCQNCNARPSHDFCGQRCAREFQNNGRRPANSRTSPTLDESSCMIPGCQRPVYVDADGNKSNFCSHRHRRDAVRTGLADACLRCKEMPTIEVGGKQSDFCSKRCMPMILEIPKRNSIYEDVAKQFTEKWMHPTPQKPTVVNLWKIYGDGSIRDRFSRYQLEAERRTGLSNGNTRRRFHGTIRACCLGDSSTDSALCTQSTCNVCKIIQSSFQLDRVGQRTTFHRFGSGIYTSATSSKANDYYGGSTSPNKAMLLNDVVMGKAIKLTTTNTTLTQPPAGYDAVIGEPGGDLNYDECIGAPAKLDVGKNDAIRASFLIVYR